MSTWFKLGSIVIGFGGLAWMAGTGALVGIDGFKFQSLAWVVETVMVGALGRAGAVALILALGVAALLLAWQRLFLGDNRR